VVGVLSDDTDPMVTVMKLEKAPQETYADIGGLDQQIQEIKVQCCPALALVLLELHHVYCKVKVKGPTPVGLRRGAHLPDLHLQGPAIRCVRWGS